MHSNLHGEASAAASLDTAPSQAGRLAVLLGNALLRELRSSRLFYGAFAVWLSVTLAATFVIGDTLLPSISVYAKRINLVVALVVLAAVAAAVLATMRARSQAGLLQAFADHLVQTDLAGRTIRLLLAVGTFVLFMACFLYWKMKITWLVPFSWDETFARMDAWLLGGRQAWDVMAPLLSGERATTTLDAAYSSWGIACVACWILVAWMRTIPAELRNHYWLATLMTWIICGLGMATWLSSAGPVYYHRVTGDHELYQSLRTFLASHDTSTLMAATLQDILWDIHAGKIEGTGGISAMPSMHNAQSLIFVLLAMHLSRGVQIGAAVFALAIFVGSVHLGWHYMVDGLVSFALVPPIWWLAGKLTGSSRAHSRAFQAGLVNDG
jgi:hypothetical protein